MKISHLTIVLFIFLIMGCQSNDMQQLPVDFNREYNTQINKRSKHFTPKYSNKITFYSDGTYIRIERTGTNLWRPEPKSIKVRFLGSWSFTDDILIMTDKEILDYKCRSAFNGEKVECDMEPDHIPLGVSEWFKAFELKAITDEYLLIMRPGYTPK